MCDDRLHAVIRNQWIRWRFLILHTSYCARLRRVEENGRSTIRSLRRKHRLSQMKGLIMAIDFRLFFIAPILSESLLEMMYESKRILFKKGEIKKLETLAEIVCHSEIEDLEKKFMKFVKTEANQ